MRPIHLTTKLIDRFYSRINETPTDTGCLDWLGHCNQNGYGVCTDGHKTLLAHRVAWTLAHGPIPDGMSIAHRCDRPQCCRVEHLFVCTHTDNMRDMVNKGRISPRGGERNPKAKLTAEQVLEIRSDKWAGRTHSEIAAHFSIGTTQVNSILLRKSWAHLDLVHDAPYEGGHAKGERTGCAKLTEQDVISIRSERFAGWTLAEIGQEFGISLGQVSYILLRKGWTHLDDAHDVPYEKGVIKLTERDVIAIRSEQFAGSTLAEIGQQFGISEAHVSNILRRKRWTHI